MKILQNKLLTGASLIICFSILTACHTVKGTVTGMGQDIQTVSNTINEQPTHHVKAHKHKHAAHHMKSKTTKAKMTKKNTTSPTTTDQTTKMENEKNTTTDTTTKMSE